MLCQSRLPDTADTVSGSFNFDYFFVKQLEVLKRMGTRYGTHKHLTINLQILTHKHFSVNTRYPCSAHAFFRLGEVVVLTSQLINPSQQLKNLVRELGMHPFLSFEEALEERRRRLELSPVF